jgi:hypothetical protein
MRGPAVLPGPLSPHGVPAVRSPRAEFDALVLGAVQDLERRWHDELAAVEFGVEETPLLADADDVAEVPLASVVPADEGGASPRVVLFRRPIELRCEDRSEVSALVLTVLVEQVAELLGRPPEEIDPRYDSE